MHHRLVAHALPHAGLAPSLWIGLGPIGVGAIALVKMASAGTAGFGAAVPTGLFVLLGLFWLLVSGRTLWGMRTGEAWRPARA